MTANNNTDVAFKNCPPFSTCKTEINDVFIDGNHVFIHHIKTNHIYIVMLMYNLIEHSDNYSDTSGSLWQFQRDEVPTNDADLSI